MEIIILMGRQCNDIADVNFDADNRKTVLHVIMTIIPLNHLLYCIHDVLSTRVQYDAKNSHPIFITDLLSSLISAYKLIHQYTCVILWWT